MDCCCVSFVIVVLCVVDVKYLGAKKYDPKVVAHFAAHFAAHFVAHFAAHFAAHFFPQVEDFETDFYARVFACRFLISRNGSFCYTVQNLRIFLLFSGR